MILNNQQISIISGIKVKQHEDMKTFHPRTLQVTGMIGHGMILRITLILTYMQYLEMIIPVMSGVVLQLEADFVEEDLTLLLMNGFQQFQEALWYFLQTFFYYKCSQIQYYNVIVCLILFHLDCYP